MSKPTGKPNGRPTLCIPEITDPIIESISKRVPYKIASQANGVHDSTFYKWMDRGEADLKAGIDSNEARFFEAVKKTEQKKIIDHMEFINEAPERWQAHAWILARRWHEHYSDNTAVVQLHEKIDAMRREMEARQNEETK